MKSNANCDIIEVLIIVHTVTGITYKKEKKETQNVYRNRNTQKAQTLDKSRT